MDARLGVRSLDAVEPQKRARRRTAAPTWTSRRQTEAYLLARETLRRLRGAVPCDAAPGSARPDASSEPTRPRDDGRARQSRG